jgi:hypothetical protein
MPPWSFEGDVRPDREPTPIDSEYMNELRKAALAR